MVTFMSQIIVVVFGITIFVAAGWGMFAPDRLMTLVKSTMDQHWGIYFAVCVRLVLGAALIGVAPASLFPIVFQVLGLIAIAAAVALVVAGRKRVRAFIAWWAERFSVPVIRLWLLFALAFAAFLVYGVL